MSQTDCQITALNKKIIDHAAPAAVRCEPSGTPKMFSGPLSGNLPICTGLVVVAFCEIMEGAL